MQGHSAARLSMSMQIETNHSILGEGHADAGRDNTLAHGEDGKKKAG